MKLIKSFAMLLFMAASIFAEGGSIYSRFGIGDLSFSYSARRSGMGQLGTALMDRDYVNTNNPASWTALNLTRFETGLSYTGYSLKDNSLSAYYTKTSFSGLTVGFPIERDLGIAMVGGIVPYSEVNYKIQNVDNAASVPHTALYEGKGGLSKCFLGLSYKLPFGISMGASLDYYIGNLKYLSSLKFENAGFNEAKYEKSYSINATGATIGLVSDDLSAVLASPNIKNLRLGVAFGLMGKSRIDTTLKGTSVLGTSDIAQAKTNLEVPYRLQTGLSLNLNNFYTFTFDYLFQPFSNYKYNDKQVTELQDLHMVSAGCEYRAGKGNEESILKSMILRAGLSYEQTQYKLNGKGINQYSAFAGFSLPMSYENTLDFSLQYSLRGTKDLGLIKEDIIKMNVSISLGEPWFTRQEK